MPEYRRCAICDRELKAHDSPDVISRDCGGDCLMCMAEAGDPDCVMELVTLLTRIINSNHAALVAHLSQTV
jgi:hypothetical protein